MHFDPKKKIIKLKRDASPYKVGAIIGHEINNIDYPILFTSKSLNEIQEKYSQFDREALAIIFALHQVS